MNYDVGEKKTELLQ